MYSSIEHLLLTYPQTRHRPLSPDYVASLIIPLIEVPEPAGLPTAWLEEQLLLHQLLLRHAPTRATVAHKIRYADLLDRFLPPHLPLLRRLLQTPAATLPNELAHPLTTLSNETTLSNATKDPGTPHPQPLTRAQRLILRQADLFAYFGPRASRLPSLLR